MAHTFHCSLVTPERQVLDDQLTYASVPMWDGLTGIAPQRAPLVGKLGDGVLRLDYPQGGSRYFFITGGFAQMKDNSLSLITSEATAAEQFSKADVAAKLKEAEARVTNTPAEADKRRRDIQRGKAILEMLSRVDNKI